jgi:hypothetical protein
MSSSEVKRPRSMIESKRLEMRVSRMKVGKMDNDKSERR